MGAVGMFMQHLVRLMMPTGVPDDLRASRVANVLHSAA